MHKSVQPVPVPTGCVYVLPSADFSDSFAVDVADDALDAPAAARRAFAEPPRWITGLLGLRNMLVAPLGLKTNTETEPADDQRFGLPLVASSRERVVLGMDDRHLDFRVVIDVERLRDTTRVTTTTLVHRNNQLGHLYLAAVMPFHKIIVPALLARLNTTAENVSGPHG
jgi:hypothetical protein